MAAIDRIVMALKTQRRPFTYRSHTLIGAVSGVYAFWIDHGACLYVGKSERIGSRLRQHRLQEHNECLRRYFHAWPADIEMSYIALNEHTPQEVALFEQQAITLLRPIANVTHNRRTRR